MTNSGQPYHETQTTHKVIHCGEGIIKNCLSWWHGKQKGDVMHHLYSEHSSLLPGHKLEWPIFTAAHPVLGHERVKVHNIQNMLIIKNYCVYICGSLTEMPSMNMDVTKQGTNIIFT